MKRQDLKMYDGRELIAFIAGSFELCPSHRGKTAVSKVDGLLSISTSNAHLTRFVVFKSARALLSVSSN